MKRLVAGLIVLAVVTGSPSVANAEVRGFDLACPPGEVPDDAFVDVGVDDAHESAIDCAAFHGIVGPTLDSFYEPLTVVSRAQMATFMARLIDAAGDLLPATAPDAFADDNGGTHEASINRLAAAGIVGGTGEGTFNPSGSVSRAQMATFLVRSYEFATDEPLPAPTVDAFADDNGGEHENAINQAAEAGFTGGTAPITFSPSAEVRRNQMASFIARVLDALAEKGLVEPAATSFLVDLDPDPTGAPPGYRVGVADVGVVRFERAAVIPVQPGQTVTVRFEYGTSASDDSFSLGVSNDSPQGAAAHYRFRRATGPEPTGNLEAGDLRYFHATDIESTFLELEISAPADGRTLHFVLGDAVLLP